MAKEKNTHKIKESEAENLSRFFSDIKIQLEHLIEILERIDQRLSGGF